MKTRPPLAKTRSTSPQQVLLALLIAAAAVFAVLIVVQVARSMLWHITFPYEIKGWAEGHSLYNALQFSRGENVYVDPDKHPVTTMAYGFLYPLLMAPCVCLFGPQLWIPRAVSTLAAVLSLAWVFRTASTQARSYVAGLAGVVFACLGYFPTGESWDWGHPDSLSMALGLASLMCVQTPDERLNRRRIAAAVILGCACCCAKQSGAGFILAVATSLLIRRWRYGVVYMLSSGLVLAAIGLTGHLMTDGQFIRYTLGVVRGRPFFLDKLGPLVQSLVVCIPLPLVLGVWETKRSFPKSGWSDPVVWALLWVGGASMSVYLGHGGVLNALMPVFFLMAVPAGIRFSSIVSSRNRSTSLRTAAWCAIVAQLSLFYGFVVRPILDSDRGLMTWHLRAGSLILAELKNPNQKILLGDRVSFAILAGIPVYDSVAIATYGKGYPQFLGWLREKMQARLKRQFTEKYFDKILIPRSEVDMLEPDVVRALYGSYRVEGILLPEVTLTFCTPMLVFRPMSA